MWLAVSFALLLCIAANDALVFRSDYHYFQGAEAWMKLHRIPAIWKDARLRCELEGAALASPVDEGILSSMSDVMKLMSPPRPVFTGIQATLSKGDFFTLEGVPLSKIPVVWAPGQPDNLNNSESCIVLHPNKGMEDVSCDIVAPFVCYKRHTEDMKMTNCGTVDKAYVYENSTGSCYKFHRRGRTWHRAFMTCAAEGGHLAVIDSYQEAMLFKNMYALNPDDVITATWKHCIALGFHDFDESGSWLTIHGKTLQESGYDTFSEGQPDNAIVDGVGEYCGGMFRNGRLDDLWCFQRTVPFICEKNPKSFL